MTKTAEQVAQTLEIIKHEEIAAPIDVVFETVLEQMGPLMGGPDGRTMSMKLEAWPGGRWYRDLGENRGHLWAHVQAIKPPSLLEFFGPLMMSCAAVSNVQYRLKEENGITHLQFTHRAFGWITEDYLKEPGMDSGWSFLLEQIRTSAEANSR